MKTLLIGLRATLVLTLLTGVLYPLLTTLVAQVVFARKAEGSLIEVGGKTIGSRLIGQKFSRPSYFQGRPSAAGSDGYDASSSGGSNLGVTSQKLRDRVTAEVDRLRKENPMQAAPIPSELVLASGSGLDPELSPAGIRWQIPRVAAARVVDATRLERVVDSMIEGRVLGIIGEPHVNVLELNLALDRQFPLPASAPAP